MKTVNKCKYVPRKPAPESPKFIPEVLPCGKQVNENYRPGQQVQCCRTECPQYDWKQIEMCAKSHKKDKPDTLDFVPTGSYDPNEKNRLFAH